MITQARTVYRRLTVSGLISMLQLLTSGCETSQQCKVVHTIYQKMLIVRPLCVFVHTPGVVVVNSTVVVVASTLVVVVGCVVGCFVVAAIPVAVSSIVVLITASCSK